MICGFVFVVAGLCGGLVGGFGLLGISVGWCFDVVLHWFLSCPFWVVVLSLDFW